jgi:hypothetical protein
MLQYPKKEDPMSKNVLEPPASSSAVPRSRGRAYLWAGLVACLLGIALAVVQLNLKILFTPWYTPILATVGVLLVLVSLMQRRSIPRVLTFLLVLALAGFEWFVLGLQVKLPAYEGPARAGARLPAFASTLADGSPFTDGDLRDGSRRALVFFRGRW